MDEEWDVGSTFHGMRNRLERLEALEKAQDRLASESNPDAILDILAESAAKIINAETLAVTLLSEDRTNLRYEYAYGKHADKLLGAVLPLENAGLCGWVLANRKPILSVNLLDDPRIVREVAISLGIHTAVLTPLIAKGGIIGGLSAFNKNDGSKFDEEDLSILYQLSGYAALAVVNARLMRDLRMEKAKADLVINSIEDGLLFVTCDGAIAEDNRAVYTLTGSKVENLVGMNVNNLDADDSLRDVIGWGLGAAPGEHCWELLQCEKKSCPAFGSDELRCWSVNPGRCGIGGEGPLEEEKLWEKCLECDVMATAEKRLAEPREVQLDGKVLRVTSVIIKERRREKIFGELMVIHDVTAEKELERQRTDFISMLSHDLKTPITSIIGYSEMIAQENELDSVRQFNKAVTNNSSRILRMINNVLDYSRVETGRLKMDRTPIGVRSFLNMTLEPFGPLAKEKDVTLEHDADEGMQEACADIDMLSRVVVNLVTNALEHVEKGGRISVNAADGPEGFVEIAVSDNGHGISPEHIPHIFDKYYSPERRRAEGSGLGLYIVKALCELQGGRVGVESEEGKGSTFRVMIPSADGCAPTEA